MIRVVVTGGCGYIGSNIVNKLLSNGYEVSIIDNMMTDIPNKNFDCEIINCDITNQDQLLSIKKKNIDAVLHLAAQSSGPKSIDIPELDININIIGTLNMLKWCQANNVPRIIFASSFVVYGDQQGTEYVRESDYCYPKSVYGISKQYCERLINIYGTHLGIKWNVLRMFNVYGPGQNLSRTDQGMVSIFMNLVKNKNLINVNGSLKRFRDFIHIEDIISGWELCLHDNDHYNQIYNLGSGVKTTISDLLQSLIVVFDKKGEVIIKEVGETPGDILGCFADISKIKNELGYKPKYDLDIGIRNMAEWAMSR